jgi:colanic acid biosynthesis glycosyl transferase WcaI
VVRAIELSCGFARYSAVVRLRQELQYARISARAILAARPDVAVLSNIPLLSLFILTLSLRMRRVRTSFGSRTSTAKRSGSLLVIGSAGWVTSSAGLRDVLSVRLRAVQRPSSPSARPSSSNSTPGSPGKQGTRGTELGRDRRGALATARQCLGKGSRPEGMPVVMYAGTLGLRHDPSVISGLAQAAPTGSRMVVVSEGQGREWLESEAGEAPRLMLFDYQPYEQLPDMLASADVLLVVLESNASRYSVPSKVLNYFCAGRPVLALLPPDNAVAGMVEAAEAGLVVAPGDADAASAALRSLLASPVARTAMGTAARRYAEGTFDVERVGDRFESLLNDVCNGQVSLPDSEGGYVKMEIAHLSGPNRAEAAETRARTTI